MSELGNIEKSYGKQINIAVANTTSSELQKSTSLPSNCIIVTSPVDAALTDTGVQSLFITDTNGTPIRLTYMIKQGNGLTVDEDILKINIDSSTIIDDNGLKIALQNLIDNNTIVIENNKLHVNTQALDIATSTTKGIVKYDGNSIMQSNDKLYVETSNLDKASNTQYGIVIGDNNTISISDTGVVSVNTNNLPKTSITNYGVCKPDNTTLTVVDSVLSVDTNELQKTGDTFGVAKSDGTTIKSTDGILSVITSGLPTASENTVGTVKIDTDSLDVTDGVISVKNYSNLYNSIKEYNTLTTELSNKTAELYDKLANGKYLLNTNLIYSVTCENTTITDLAKPSYKEEPKNMAIQRVYVVLDIICNCEFTIDVDITNNEAPAIDLSQINYNDEFSYQDYEGLLQTYPSTDMKQKRVVLLFNCRNFCSSVKPYKEVAKIAITIASKEDKTQSKTILYSITRYNSYINTTNEVTTNTNAKTHTLVALEDTSLWQN